MSMKIPVSKTLDFTIVSNTFWTKIPQNSQSAKRAIAMTSEEAARLSRTFSSQLRFGNQSHCISDVVSCQLEGEK